MAQNEQYAKAEVIQSSPSHAPVLSAGRLTISVLRSFQNSCRRFFSTKGVSAADQVGKIIYNFEGNNIQGWIYAEEARLIELMFAEFITELKKKFLLTSWEDKLVEEQISLQGEKNFLTWVAKVRNTNSKLQSAGSGYHIPTDKLRVHFVLRLGSALKLAYKAKRRDLDMIADLDEWIEHVQLLDQECREMRATWLKLAMAQGKTASRPGTSNGGGRYAKGSNSNNESAGPSTSIPRLTEEEQKLLDDH
jgi:hypothetical protein